MKTEDVICLIDGTKFIVDVPGDRLVQQDVPSNSISFGYMLNMGTYYLMAYDPAIKNMPSIFEDTPGKILRIEVPPLTELAPLQMAEFYGLHLKDVIGKRDTDIIFNIPEIKERLAQPYAIYHLGDDQFRIDIQGYRLVALNSQIKPTPIIFFKDMDYDADQQVLIGYYDSKQQKLVKFDNRYLDTKKYPHIKRIEIPQLSLIDPIGVALDMKEDPYIMLRASHRYKNMHAKVLSISGADQKESLEKRIRKGKRNNP